MINYIIKRLGYGLLVLLGVVFIIFFLFYLLPVNSARLTLGQRADVSSVKAIEKELHLNEPWYTRLALYVNDVSPLSFHNKANPESNIFLDEEKYSYTTLIPISNIVFVAKTPYLGRSYQTKRKVTAILSDKIPPTLILAFTSILLATILGVLLGVVAALNHNSFWDSAAVVTSVIGISQPSYFSAIVLALVFGFLLHDWTGLNHAGPLFGLNDYGEEVVRWKNLVLPAIALGIRPIAIIVQLTRSSMLDVLSQDYVRTAKAKGLSRRIVLFKHALRNAMNPVVTSVSGWFASLLAGAYFVEIIFDFKGLGYETVKALQNFDFPVVMGSVLFTACIFVGVNIFVDVIYGFLDPRISIRSN
jgi:peptide/nickel transport system permease protein